MTLLLSRLPAILLLAASTLAHAAAPQVRTQAPGFYRMMLGDFEITALSDGTHAFPIDSVMTHIAPAQIASDLDQAELRQPVQGSINAFLVNTGSKLILIDAGAGQLYGDCCGKLVDHLRAAGYRPEQVDEVLAGPGHMPDHAMYLVSSHGQQLLVWGDIVHVSAIQLPHPQATVKYDSSEADASATRRQLLEMAAGKHMLVGAAHITFPGLGHIAHAGAGYQWLPLNYDSAPSPFSPP
jgi:glyoxylase-like metal-dependent hydrolase (beta-lactamase superfamily II)